MQPIMKYSKQINLSLMLIISLCAITPSMRADKTSTNVAGKDFLCTMKNPQSAIATAVFVTALATFLRLVTKKTQVKRVYPKDDSLAEVFWYLFDELLTGQMEKGERPSKVVMDPNNPTQLNIEYAKVEARGVAGILYSKMKPVILPAMTLMVLFNKDFKAKLLEGIRDIRIFIDNPTKIYTDLKKAINDPL